MKKSLLAMLGLTLIASAAFGQQVLSRNAVGYTRITTYPNTYNLQSIPFNAFVNNLQAVFTNQLTGGPHAGIADNVVIWDNANSRYWTYYKTTSGGWRSSDSGADPSTSVFLGPGDAFWIVNRHSTTQEVYLMGEVPDRYTTPTAEVAIAVGYQFTSYSYPISIAITNLNFTNAQAGAHAGIADNIWTWNPSASANGSYQQYFYRTGPPNYWRSTTSSVATTDSLLPGQGFWYIRRGATPFTWGVAKPYTWP